MTSYKIFKTKSRQNQSRISKETVIKIPINDVVIDLFSCQRTFKLHQTCVCKKQRIAIIMHECDNSGTFDNIMRIFHSISQARFYARCEISHVCEQSKYVKRSSGGLQCGEFPRRQVQLCGIDRVGLFVRLFGALLATATSGRRIRI